MQYVVRGNLKTYDDTKIKGIINRYRTLDKESLKPFTDDFTGKPSFTFELKTKDLSKKNGMFEEFKTMVDEYMDGSEVDWHECRHDEGQYACTIAETYRRE